MTEILTFSIEEVVPTRDMVLAHQGIPADRAVPPRVEAVLESACDLLAQVARPAGIVAEISIPEFGSVYAGEGRNEPETPVGEIYARADRLTLFAVTLSEPVVKEIARRFSANDLALGSMLDSAASVAADRLAAALQERHAGVLAAGGDSDPGTAVLRYSPGYCGWHLSGQRRLFAYLHPERIGITLRDSFLMEPLKSVSGVLIAGPREIHGFQDAYSFCDGCDSRGCRERLRALHVR